MGARKFTVIVLLLVVGVWFRVLDYINGREFVDLMSATIVAFMSVNGIEHATSTVKEWLKNKTKENADVIKDKVKETYKEWREDLKKEKEEP
jgi:hypothetical protein